MEWIKCSERLPECEKLVLIFVKNPTDKSSSDGIYMAEYCKYVDLDRDYWYVYRYNVYGENESIYAHNDGPEDVASHWMPLPEKPMLDE